MARGIRIERNMMGHTWRNQGRKTKRKDPMRAEVITSNHVVCTRCGKVYIKKELMTGEAKMRYNVTEGWVCVIDCRKK